MAHTVAILEPDAKERATLEATLRRAGYAPLDQDLSTELLERHQSMAFQFEVLAPLGDARLIIMDSQLPGLDGIAAIRLFKQNKYTVQIPIMVITADNRYDSVLSCVRAGAADYLVKPVDEATLLRRIALLLGRNGSAGTAQGVESVIWNFQDFLVRELKRSERSKLSLSIILGRIGKPDEILADTSSLQRETSKERLDLRLGFIDAFISSTRRKVRDVDTVLRQGPEGLVVVLPMTPKGGASIVEERLAETFESERAMDDTLELRRLQLFTGVSSFPEEATSRHELLIKAEKNLSLRLSGGARRTPQHSPRNQEEQVFWKRLHCPVCKEQFQVEKGRERAFHIKERESDFRPIYEMGNPLLYAIPACPRCYYAAFLADFEGLADTEIAKLKKTRQSRSRFAKDVDLRAPRTLESAVVSYRLAADCYQKRRTPPSTLARLYHRAAWLLRESGQREAEKEMLQKALQSYERSFLRENLKGKKLGDLQVAFLIGEINLRLEHPQKALEYFGTVIRTPKDKVKKQLIQLARDRWYDAKKALEEGIAA